MDTPELEQDLQQDETIFNVGLTAQGPQTEPIFTLGLTPLVEAGFDNDVLASQAGQDEILGNEKLTSDTNATEQGTATALSVRTRKTRRRPEENGENTTMLQRIRQFTKPYDAELVKKKRENNAEAVAERQRSQFRQELGAAADEGILDLFGERAPTVEGLGNDSAPDLFGESGGDFFDFQAPTSQRVKLPPFPGAYKKSKAARWEKDDEKKFIDAIAMHKTDFMMIGALFPNKSAKELVRKFRELKRQNSKQLDRALKARPKIDTESFEKLRGAIDPTTHHVPDEGGEVSELALIQDLSRRERKKTELVAAATSGNFFTDMFGADDNAGEGDELPVLDQLETVATKKAKTEIVEQPAQLPEISDSIMEALLR